MSASPPDPAYREILTAIIRRYIRLLGSATALSVARRTPELVVDDAGTVLDFDRNNPLLTISQVIENFGAIFGEAALKLARPAVTPAAAPPGLLQEAGLLARPPLSRLLLVDDAVLFRESLVNLLRQEPDLAVVGQAGSVAEAIQVARAVQPDIILMDFSLPDGTGLDATVTILAERPETKIVFLTVHEDDERLFGAVRAGARGYVYKNAHAVDLVQTLQGVARGEAGLSRALARRILDEFARTPAAAAAEANEHPELTVREGEIIRELAHGQSNKEIAARLVISENTVKNHVRNVLTKLHLRSRREVAKYARDHGLLLHKPK